MTDRHDYQGGLPGSIFERAHNLIAQLASVQPKDGYYTLAINQGTRNENLGLARIITLAHEAMTKSGSSLNAQPNGSAIVKIRENPDDDFPPVRAMQEKLSRMKQHVTSALAHIDYDGKVKGDGKSGKMYVLAYGDDYRAALADWKLLSAVSRALGYDDACMGPVQQYLHGRKIKPVSEAEYEKGKQQTLMLTQNAFLAIQRSEPALIPQLR